MNHFYLVVCFVNIFVFSVNCAPTPATTNNIFDLIQSYSVKNCPALSKNVLIDKNMTYLSRCRDVSLDKVPADVAFDSMNAYLCVGILEADFRLCNVLANASYPGLAKSYEDLRESIEIVGKNKADQVCAEFKNFTSTITYSSDIVAKLDPWMSKFNEQLFGTGCSILCSEFGHKTNVFCSLLIYINVYIQSIQNAIQQRTLTASVISSPKVPVKTSVENVKPDNAESVSVPLAQPKLPLAPVVQAHEAAKVQQNVEQQVKTTKVDATTTNKQQVKTTKVDATTTNKQQQIKPAKVDATTTNKQQQIKPTKVEVKTITTTETTLTTKPQTDRVGGAKTKDSQTQTKPEVALEQGQAKLTPNMAAPPVVEKEPIDDVKPKESNQLENDKIDDKTPTVLQNSAPETQNTDGENKLETPETKAEAVDKNAAIEPTDKVDNGIFEPTVSVGLKEPKQESYFDEDDDANFKLDEDAPGPDKEQEVSVPVISDQSITPREYADVEDSNFFAYFMFISVMFIAGYVVYHNKQKILALVLEGRRDRNARRRPNTASYRKLNSNLEEAVTSKCSGSAAHVIY